MDAHKWEVPYTCQEVKFYIKSTIGSNINIQRTSFENNFASQYGGAIYALSFQNISINHTSTFANNFANEFGGDLYLSDSNGMITITRTSIKNLVSKDSIFLNKVSFEMLSSNMLSKFRYIYSTRIINFE